MPTLLIDRDAGSVLCMSISITVVWTHINELFCVLDFDFNIHHIITALDLKRAGLPSQRV